MVVLWKANWRSHYTEWVTIICVGPDQCVIVPYSIFTSSDYYSRRRQPTVQDRHRTVSQRESQPLSSLLCKTLRGHSAAWRALHDNPESSSIRYCHKVHLRYFLFTLLLFFKQCHQWRKLHLAHYSLSLAPLPSGGRHTQALRWLAVHFSSGAGAAPWVSP